MSLRVVFWGNSQSVFSSRHFDALLNIPCELTAVVDLPQAYQSSTNPLPAGLPDFCNVARQRNIPVLAPVDPNEHRLEEKMRALAPDLFVAAGYAQILKPALLATPKLLAVNFHASLLPHYRGKHPVFWTLRGGEEWAGLTVHVMDPGIDTGDIIYQVKVRTRQEDTVSSLYHRIMNRSVDLIGDLITDVMEGTIPSKPQPAGQGSYFSSTTAADFHIRWGWDSEKIRRYIVMTPGKCFTLIASRRVYLSQAKKASDKVEGVPGTILNLGRKYCTIASGDGAVSIGQGKIEDGQEQTLASLCRQQGKKLGDLLV